MVVLAELPHHHRRRPLLNRCWWTTAEHLLDRRNSRVADALQQTTGAATGYYHRAATDIIVDRFLTAAEDQLEKCGRPLQPRAAGYCRVPPHTAAYRRILPHGLELCFKVGYFKPNKLYNTIIYCCYEYACLYGYMLLQLSDAFATISLYVRHSTSDAFADIYVIYVSLYL